MKKGVIEQKLLFEFKECPTCYTLDDKYQKHCVDCGLLLIEYEYVWNGYDRPEAGKTLQEIKHHIDFGGRRCLSCYKKLKEFVEMEYYGDLRHRT